MRQWRTNVNKKNKPTQNYFLDSRTELAHYCIYDTRGIQESLKEARHHSAQIRARYGRERFGCQ